MSKILKINELWGGYQERHNILKGISMEVELGETVGIIGLNGSGKSTFGKAVMNMLPFRRGEIIFGDEDITLHSTSQLSQLGISFMQQGGRIFKNLSVWDNLQLALSKQSPDNLGTLKNIIPMLQIPKKELQRTMADKLSGGQKHQLSLAMTLATSPRLVILDEPSAGLSPKAVEDMYITLYAIRKSLDVTIILIEQNISKAMMFCDECMLLQNGQFVNKLKDNSIYTIEKLMFNK